MDEIRGTLSTSAGHFAVTISPMDDPSPERPRASRVAYPKTTRIRLLSVQGHRCAICGGPLGFYDSHIDHIIARALGGSDDLSNLQLVHMNCNLRKGVGRGPHDRGQERMPWA